MPPGRGLPASAESRSGEPNNLRLIRPGTRRSPHRSTSDRRRGHACNTPAAPEQVRGPRGSTTGYSHGAARPGRSDIRPTASPAKAPPAYRALRCGRQPRLALPAQPLGIAAHRPCRGHAGRGVIAQKLGDPSARNWLHRATRRGRPPCVQPLRVAARGSGCTANGATRAGWYGTAPATPPRVAAWLRLPSESRNAAADRAARAPYDSDMPCRAATPAATQTASRAPPARNNGSRLVMLRVAVVAVALVNIAVSSRSARFDAHSVAAGERAAIAGSRHLLVWWLAGSSPADGRGMWDFR